MSYDEYIKEYEMRIHKVQDYIEENIGTSMSIEELADAAGFSKYHFSRIFRSILNESLGHYLNRIRMERAMFLLAHRRDKNMTNIAYELGFTDSSVFSRSFKNYYGVGPREYRKKYSNNCKEKLLLSDYNKGMAEKEWEHYSYPVKGRLEMVDLNETTVVYVRHTGTYEELSKEFAWLINRLFSLADENGILIGGKNKVLAVYHDNPEFGDSSQFRTSLCLTVPDGVNASSLNGLETMEIDGGRYAVGHFELAKNQYSDAWNYMYREWIAGKGFMPRDSSPFEVYISVPENLDKQMVDIYVPVEPIVF